MSRASQPLLFIPRRALFSGRSFDRPTDFMVTTKTEPFAPLPLWEKACVPVFWLDSELKLTWVNRAWERLTGFRADAVVGLTSHAHAPTRGDDLADLVASFHPPPESVAGQPCGTQTLILQAGGEPIWRRVEFWPFCDEQDALLGLLGMVRALDGPPSVPNSCESALHVELLEIRRGLQKQAGFDGLIGSGPAHRRLLDQVRLASASAAPVLIVGESGTGKRQVARTIHQNSPGRHLPLVPFDCEALPAEILERELFGAETSLSSESGATSSASKTARPRLSLGDGSTILIREILMLPRDLQARLAASLDSPVRLLGTTALDPDIALGREQIRPELYFVLTTLVLRLAPLRDRRHELPVLAQHMLERANQRGGKQRTGFSPQVIAAFMSYDWPGNLQELARVVDSAHARAGDSRLTIDDLPAPFRSRLGESFLPPTAPSPIKPLDQLLTEVERRLIETALRQARGNKSRAAEILGISRPRLYRRIKELELPDDAEGPEVVDDCLESPEGAKS
jgi:DNA-binding NtrC family response regulator